MLPMIRDNQYSYAKFFVLWPVIVALGSTSFDRRKVVVIAVAVLALNGSLIARDVVRGRRVFAEISALYSSADANTCFFTSGWGAPLSYRWPGTTVGVIGTLATGADPATQARELSASLERCFCTASAVWTDTTADSAPTVALLTTHFQYAVLDLSKILHPSSEGLLPGTQAAPVYAYSPARRTEPCRLVRAASPFGPHP